MGPGAAIITRVAVAGFASGSPSCGLTSSGRAGPWLPTRQRLMILRGKARSF
jgi:hypothetical protein